MGLSSFLFSSTPYIHLYGPKGSGKTQAEDILFATAFKPILSPSLTPAAIYQTLDRYHPTFLIDECDMPSAKNQNEYTREIIKVLNSGYKRNQRVIRASREGSDPVLYDTFGPKAIASVEPLPPTLADRTIRIDCERNVKNIPLELDSPKIREVADCLEGYNAVYAGTASSSKFPKRRPLDVDPELLKDEIKDNRVTELFFPLIAVCPSLEGRRNLLSLAKETVAERRKEEAVGDLAEVLEAVWTAAGKPDLTDLSRNPAEKPREIPLSAVIENCSFETMPSDVKDRSKWIGWRLNKLQLPRDRLDQNAQKIRIVLVPDRKLYRLARRYLPYAFQDKTVKTGETVASANHLPESIGPARFQPQIPSQTVSTVLTVSSGETRAPPPVTGLSINDGSDWELALRTLSLVRGPWSWDYCVDALELAFTDRTRAEGYANLFKKEGVISEGPEGCWQLTKGGPSE
jgi:hypothetical protein